MVQPEPDGVACPQPAQKMKGIDKDGRDMPKDECYNCGTVGHHTKECPKLTANEKQDFQRLGMKQVNIMEDAGVQECAEGVNQLNIAQDDENYDSIIDGVGFIEPSIVDVVKRDRATCDPRNLYIDSCATNSSIGHEPGVHHGDAGVQGVRRGSESIEHCAG